MNITEVFTSYRAKQEEYVEGVLASLSDGPVIEIPVIEAPIEFHPDMAVWLEDKSYPLGTKHVEVNRYIGFDPMSGPDYINVNRMASISRQYEKAPF